MYILVLKSNVNCLEIISNRFFYKRLCLYSNVVPTLKLFPIFLYLRWR